MTPPTQLTTFETLVTTETVLKPDVRKNQMLNFLVLVIICYYWLFVIVINLLQFSILILPGAIIKTLAVFRLLPLDNFIPTKEKCATLK